MHLSIRHPPMFRKLDKLVPVGEDVLDKSTLKRMIFSLLNEEQINQFTRDSELNTAVTILTIDASYRFRLNVHLQQDIVEAIFHLIPVPVPSLSELNLPGVVASFARKKSGLVVITGLSGSGKTTTCAALIDLINQERSSVIMTFQKPIEYIYTLKKSIIKQREIGVDTKSFAIGLKQVLYQDVDVLVVAEVPDSETMELVINAAAKGKLVFLILSAPSVTSAIQKIIYAFPADKQYYSRKILSQVLQGVIFQMLLPVKNNGTGKQIIATEILVNSPEAAEVIRDGILEKLSSVMQNDTNYGMRKLDKSLKELCDTGFIDEQKLDDEKVWI